MLEPDDGPVFGLLNCLSTTDEPAVRALLAERGFATLELRGEMVRDKAELLDQFAAGLPGVGDLRPHNWDALADVLWNVLYDLDEERVALVWTGAQTLVESDLQDLLDAVRVVSDVARSVGSASGGFPRQTTFVLVMLGDGPQFRRLAPA